MISVSPYHQLLQSRCFILVMQIAEDYKDPDFLASGSTGTGSSRVVFDLP